MIYDSEHRSSPDERAFMGGLADLSGQALKRVRLQQARVEPATALRQTMLPPLPEHLGRSGSEWPHVDYKVLCERCRMRVAARHPGAKDL
ncbi:hypothetical protein SSPO_006420 [Streptomyces antimycoticus]|uniref:Uncharacterized protein n=1 Tax=Streptomyces antimycoticus TaxID=68175 RepID=A0A499UAU8_9ACTN|nr:hypothetical protein [Streptomyces antimycoticus]BBJ37924.1 hypothetical protein SSPO_006420 [Streptomyces antimycoticus]